MQKGLVVILVGAHCRLITNFPSRFCNFFVNSSRLVYFSGVFRQFLARSTAVLLLSLMLCLSLLDLVELAAPPGL